MRIGLVVDSGCDLPKSFIDANNILVMPISIRIGKEIFVDNRDPQRLREFYQRQTLDKSQDAESAPLTVEQIKALFLDQAVIDFDYALVQTVPKSRSPIFDNAMEAAHAILREYKPVRQKAGIEGPFAVRVSDSQTLFAGQGVLAAETIRLIKTGMRVGDIRQRIADLTPKTTGYAVVPDLYYVHKRARKKGDKSVGFVGALMGSALDIKPILCARQDQTFPVAKVRGFDTAVERMFAHARHCIDQGLLSPIICISYAGDEEAVYQMPGFEQLKNYADQHKVELLISNMGLTGGVNIGPGAISIGLITEETDFE
ncbi:MAG: DegV family protein [Alcanivorax sp.]|nr:DegV family protein [Alcanivorax sp.]